MFLDDTYGIVRVIVLAPLAYAALVASLRAAGKRTLATFNAFDFVVTVALGSTLSTIILTSDVALAEGIAAIATLVVAQYLVAKASVRFESARRALKSRPTLLVHHGAFLHDALHDQRVTAGEVRQAVRASGAGEIASVGAVVLETDGTLSVIPLRDLGAGDVLQDVDGHRAAV